jgi:pimeloyl-ACP methyl ester carboxylesterase
MAKQHVSTKVSQSKGRSRRWLVWLGGIVAVLLGLTLLGALYESWAEASDARVYPAPGQMVDVGGYRLHINCEGTGAPTVVIEAGWGDWSATWSSWVQPEVAKTTKVCVYDRAGMGWSEPGPLPRTAERFASELHTLLHNAKVTGPYVLVGHSSGGLTMRLYAHDYATEVAGVVLVDSMNPKEAKSSGSATPPQASGHTSDLSLPTLPARLGLMRLFAGPLQLSAGLSPKVANAYVARSVTPRAVQTTLDEGQGMPQSFVQAGAVTSFGATPLIVLTRGKGADQAWQNYQTNLLHLSSNSHQMIAEQSGHNIQLDQPKAAVGAIVTMVQQLRSQAAQ